MIDAETILKAAFPQWEGVNKYVEFIKTNSTKLNKGHTQAHHILPKSIFPEYAKDPSNIVHLTHYNHFIAHAILSETKDYRMLQAINRMNNSKTAYKCSFEEFEEMAKIYSKVSTEISKAISIKMSSYYSIAENRIKISQAVKRWFENSDNLKIHLERVNSNEFKSLVSKKTKEWFENPENKIKHLNATRLSSKNLDYRKSLSLGVSQSWKNDEIREAHLKSRRKSYQWQNFDLLYTEWIKMNKPRYSTFSKELIKLGHPITSSLQAIVAEFDRRILNENF
ncbi:MobD-like homing endonuclease [Salmonella phage Melville]|uniref:MobD-like homing endonuclease n=1 Tax=Salmonella phage Melville TaxID=2041413 RepID=A0A2D1GM76_9CAUD|nr:homing endonuclease [Salmonella phage Melville]ATN93021.1 MobD-like homing endonuclease [Salmonella phage Melville]